LRHDNKRNKEKWTTLDKLIQQATAVDSVWSIVIRGVIWIIISFIIIISMDNPNADLAHKKMKANLGFFIILCSCLGV
jgi:hypothetical protein